MSSLQKSNNWLLLLIVSISLIKHVKSEEYEQYYISNNCLSCDSIEPFLKSVNLDFKQQIDSIELIEAHADCFLTRCQNQMDYDKLYGLLLVKSLSFSNKETNTGIDPDTLANLLFNFYDKSKHPNKWALVAFFYARSSESRVRYSDAYYYSIRALDVFKQSTDTMSVVKCCNYLANLCTKFNEFEKANSYLEQAINYYRNETHGVKAWVKASLVQYVAENYFLKGDINLAVELLKENQKFIKDNIHTNDLWLYLDFVGKYKLASCYVEQSSLIEAKNLLDSASLIITSVPNLNSIAEYYFTNAKYWSKIKNNYNTLQYIDSVKEITKSTKNLELKLDALKLEYNVYSEMNKLKPAFYSLSDYVKIKDSINSMDKIKDFFSEGTKMMSEAHLHEKELIEEEFNAAKKKSSFLLIIVSLSTLLIFFLILFLRSQKKSSKQKSQIQLLKNKELKNQIEILNLQKEKQSYLIESKNKELSAHILQIQSSEETIKKIESILDRSNINSSIGQSNSTELKNLIKQNTHLKNNFKLLEKSFRKTNPQFYKILKSRSSNITDGEIKLCILMKIGLGNKEIAKILNITPESLKKSRYRIKKKLELPKEQSLSNYVQNLQNADM